jgi:DNA repair protein RadC
MPLLREAEIRYTTRRVTESTVILSAEDAAYLVGDMQELTVEHFVVLVLNMRHRVICRQTIGIGSIGEVVIHPREVFRAAIMSGGAAVVLIHNHPSGDPNPSEEDLLLTRRMAQAGQILGISVLDHVVIGDGCFRSIAELAPAILRTE